jgi:hypothetical protein
MATYSEDIPCKLAKLASCGQGGQGGQGRTTCTCELREHTGRREMHTNVFVGRARFMTRYGWRDRVSNHKPLSGLLPAKLGSPQLSCPT